MLPPFSIANVAKEAVESEKLIQRFRRNCVIVNTVNRSERQLLGQTMNIFNHKNDLGGEGVMYIQASKNSGYWFITMFAVHGRAFSRWPMLIYTSYVVTIVVVMMHFKGDFIRDPANSSIFTGLQASLSLVGVALFFLQTFRTNSAYNRWWEGRIIWGNISHQLIGIATSVSAGNITSRKLARRLLRWSLAFIITLKLSLRGTDSLGELLDIMSPAEIKMLQALPLSMRSILCITKIKQAWGQAQCNDTILECASKEMERVVPEITVSMGATRRIMGTPMPFAYISHLRSFLWIWISVLPFVFMYYMTYLAIAVCLVLAYSLLGMEAISLEIEAPFGNDFNDLPIDNLTDDVANILLGAYESTNDLPAPDGDDGDGFGLQWSEMEETKAALSTFGASIASEDSAGMGAGASHSLRGAVPSAATATLVPDSPEVALPLPVQRSSSAVLGPSEERQAASTGPSKRWGKLGSISSGKVAPLVGRADGSEMHQASGVL